MNESHRISCPPLPIRSPTGHKGTFGRVLLVGGSAGMSGSIVLAATAALRSGSGLVTAAVPTTIQSIVAAYEPSYMTLGLAADASGSVDISAAVQVSAAAAEADAVGIGPGLGTSAAAERLVRTMLMEARCPLVLDADALNVMAAARLLDERNRSANCLLTPHPGEFARLTGSTTASIQADRVAHAMKFAQQFQVVLILKGSQTVVTDGRQLYCNTTGNSGMGTGGSGDVLTGVVTSLLGQGMGLLEAASLAVHVHGLAGDLAARDLTERGLIASDLLHYLPHAWRQLESRVPE